MCIRDRYRAADVPQLHVEGIALSIRVERLLIEAVGPRTDERNAAQPRARLELLDRLVRPPEDLVSFHFHRERDVADTGQDRHDSLAASVLELNDIAGSTRRVRLRPGCPARYEAENRESRSEQRHSCRDRGAPEIASHHRASGNAKAWTALPAAIRVGRSARCCRRGAAVGFMAMI